VNQHGEKASDLVSRYYFYGQPCEAAQTREKHGKKPESRISCAINPVAIMPELSLLGKKFGNRSRHRTIPSRKLAKSLEEHRERVSNGTGEASGKMTFGVALTIHQLNQAG
jgi:hypothetical protein